MPLCEPPCELLRPCVDWCAGADECGVALFEWPGVYGCECCGAVELFMLWLLAVVALWLLAEFAVLPFGRAKLSLPAGGRGTLCDCVALLDPTLFEPPADGGRGTLCAAGLLGALARASVCAPVGP